ncbi:MAG: hypothetical protein ACLGHT_00075, partial [Acidimicrobiia bacterium]
LMEALDLVGEEPSPERARLLARLSMALLIPAGELRPDAKTGYRYAEEAARIAAEIGDPRLIADVARSTLYIDSFLNAVDPETRLRQANSLREMGRCLGDPILECVALGWIYGSYMLNFDTAAAAAALDEYSAIADQTHRAMDRYFAVGWRVSFLLYTGEIDAAQRLNSTAVEEFGHEGWPIVFQAWAATEFALRRWRGGLEEILPVVEANATEPSNGEQWQVALAYILAEVGRVEEARAALDRVDVPGLTDFGTAQLQFCLVAMTASVVGDERAAQEAVAYLATRENQNVTVGFTAFLGSASYFLAVAETLLGRFEAGEHHFRRAMADNLRGGARPWLAETQFEFAKFLRARGDSSGEAEVLLAESLATCEELVMPRLAERVRELMAS